MKFQGCFKKVQKGIQVRLKGLSSSFQEAKEYVKEGQQVLGKFQGCFKEVSKKFQESFKSVSRKFLGYFMKF